VDCWEMCVQVGVLIYSKTTMYRAGTPACQDLAISSVFLVLSKRAWVPACA
jgi:hypothetical protein